MEYHSWLSLIDEARRVHGKDYSRLPLKEQFLKEAEALLKFPFKNPQTRIKRLIRLCMEYDWIKFGRPYYNVHPMMVKKLILTNLDKIPAKFIEVPENLPAICIRFTDNIQIRILDSNQGMHVRAAPDIKESLVGCRCALFGRYNLDHEKMLHKLLPECVGEDQFMLIVDEGCRCISKDDHKTHRMLCNLINFGVRGEETIPQAMERAYTELDGSMDQVLLMTMKDRLENLFRIIITIGFLADDPCGIITPDLLNKDQRAYEQALARGDTAKISSLHSKAKRRHKFGWNVGTSEIFAESRPVASPRGTGTGRELQWSHIRGGHPHAVRHGVGKKQIKIKWFRPTRVKPGLPFKEE